MRVRAITRGVAKAFDAERRVLQIYGELAFLKFQGRDANPVYRSLTVFGRGWLPEAKEQQDGGFHTEVQLADVDGDASGYLTGEDRATHFAIDTTLYEILDERTEKPIAEPFIWKVRGEERGETYGA